MAIEFEIKKNIAVLSKRGSGWSKEINIISWDGKPEKFDIREWAPEHDKMGKGVTLSEDELWVLYQAMKEYFGEETVSKSQGEDVNSVDIERIFFGKR